MKYGEETIIDIEKSTLVYIIAHSQVQLDERYSSSISYYVIVLKA